MKELHAPGAVRWIARTLEEAGFETWAVGGAVRDALAGISGEDWDLTTRATPRQMQRLFRRTIPIGVEHGTVGILARDGTLYEVTTFRRDVETTGRHAVVAFAERLEEDLARRDFTINAVAWHPLRQTLQDPYDGVGDLEKGILRTVGAPEDRFAEDYLRVLRALRFAGRFRLRVEPRTWRAICGAVDHLPQLSAERIREELEKVLQDSGRPSAALSLYAASGVLGLLYPELAASLRPPSSRRSAEGRWSTALRAVDLLPAEPLEYRLAALLSVAGGGSEETAVQSAAFLTRIRSSNARIRMVGGWAQAVAHPPRPDASPAELRRWLAGVGRDEVRGALRVLAALIRAGSAPLDPQVRAATHRGGARILRALRAELQSGAPLAVEDLALSGRDLIRMGYRPGPAFGHVLSRLLDEVLEDPSRNQQVRLARRAQALLGGGGGQALPSGDGEDGGASTGSDEGGGSSPGST